MCYGSCQLTLSHIVILQNFWWHNLGWFSSSFLLCSTWTSKLNPCTFVLINCSTVFLWDTATVVRNIQTISKLGTSLILNTFGVIKDIFGFIITLSQWRASWFHHSSFINFTIKRLDLLILYKSSYVFTRSITLNFFWGQTPMSTTVSVQFSCKLFTPSAFTINGYIWVDTTLYLKTFLHIWLWSSISWTVLASSIWGKNLVVKAPILVWHTHFFKERLWIGIFWTIFACSITHNNLSTTASLGNTLIILWVSILRTR